MVLGVDEFNHERKSALPDAKCSGIKRVNCPRGHQRLPPEDKRIVAIISVIYICIAATSKWGNTKISAVEQHMSIIVF